jgi:hypothetical protein
MQLVNSHAGVMNTLVLHRRGETFILIWPPDESPALLEQSLIRWMLEEELSFTALDSALMLLGIKQLRNAVPGTSFRREFL